MRYRKITATRWHHLVAWAISATIGQMIARNETDMSIERFVQRGKHLRREAFYMCAESRHALQKER